MVGFLRVHAEEEVNLYYPAEESRPRSSYPIEPGQRVYSRMGRASRGHGLGHFTVAVAC